MPAIDRLLVGVQARELPLLGHVDAVRALLLDAPQAAVERSAKASAMATNLHVGLGAQGVDGRAGAAAAAADQGDLDRVAAGGVDLAESSCPLGPRPRRDDPYS